MATQLMAHILGGKVETAPVSEYGKTEVDVNTSSVIFEGVSEKTICWMSHTDYIAEAPAGFKSCASVRWNVRKRNSTQPSSIRRLCILRKV